MRDEDKAKEELIAELVQLRRQNTELRDRVAELERSGVKIGQVLLDIGCITPSQLQMGLQAQKEEVHSHKRLGEIMVEGGFITKEERDSALKIQRMRQTPDIGRTLIEMGYLTKAQLEWALGREQRESLRRLSSSGRKSVSEILLEYNVVTKEQLQSALAEIERQTGTSN